MAVSPLGLLVVLLSVVALIAGSRWAFLICASASPLVQATALSVGANRFPPFYLAVVTLILIVGIRRPRAQWHPGTERSIFLTLLLSFWIYSVVSAFLAPWMFEGIRVLIPREGIDEQVSAPGVLHFSVSNVAQALYLTLACAFVYLVGKYKDRQTDLVFVAVTTGTILNTIELVSKSFGIGFTLDSWIRPDQLLFESTFGDTERFRGVYSEPSYLATFAVLGFFYSLVDIVESERLCRKLTVRSVVSGLNLLLCGVFVASSLSGTAVVGFLIVLGMISVSGVVRLARGQLLLSYTLVVSALFVLLIAFLHWSRLAGFFTSIASAKTGSDSFANRTSADRFSLDILRNSWFLGAGLGSTRPSSFLALLLSNVGIIGTILFLGIVFIVVRAALRSECGRADAWAAIALLVSKFVAEPNLSNPLLWLTLSACVVHLRQSVGEVSHVQALRR